MLAEQGDRLARERRRLGRPLPGALDRSELKKQGVARRRRARVALRREPRPAQRSSRWQRCSTRISSARLRDDADRPPRHEHRRRRRRCRPATALARRSRTRSTASAPTSPSPSPSRTRGNFQEAGIKVTLTIQQKNPIVKTQTIDLINPGQDEDADVLEPRRGHVRDPRARQRRREAGPGRGRRSTTTRPATRSCSRSARRCTSRAATALVVALAGLAVGAISLGLAWWGCQGAARARRPAAAARRRPHGPRRVRGLAAGRGSTTCTGPSTRSRPGSQRVDRRVDGAVANSAIVRYDAYEDTGGHQSASLALLDSARTGVVVTAIQGRDYARIYMKELDRGRASVDLSPEEQRPSSARWAG